MVGSESEEAGGSAREGGGRPERSWTTCRVAELVEGE